MAAAGNTAWRMKKMSDKKHSDQRLVDSAPDGPNGSGPPLAGPNAERSWSPAPLKKRHRLGGLPGRGHPRVAHARYVYTYAYLNLYYTNYNFTFNFFYYLKTSTTSTSTTMPSGGQTLLLPPTASTTNTTTTRAQLLRGYYGYYVEYVLIAHVR